MAGYPLKEIATAVSGKFTGEGEMEIRQVAIDSRTIVPSTALLFFAIRGDRHDGHSFIPELYKAGIRNFVIQDYPLEGGDYKDANIILVKDSLAALQQLAAYHRSHFSKEVLGITGSNGKTVVKEWIHQLLDKDRKICRSPKSFNSQVGVPLSVMLLEEIHDMGMFEAGISEPGEMAQLQGIIRPDTGIITNIGEAHQENFKDLEQKVREKIILFSDAQTLIYCSDHELIDRLVRDAYPDKELITWSGKKEATVSISRTKQESGFTVLLLAYKKRDIEFRIPFSDAASLENAMHAITYLLHSGYREEYIAGELLLLTHVAMRLELVKGANRCTLINDSYNSDLYSLGIALDYLKQQNQHLNKSLILSDIQQSGKPEAELYAEVATLLRDKGINNFTGIGPGLIRNRDFFPEGSHFFESTEEFISGINKYDFNDEAILIKGSRSFAFERIVHAMEEKVHSTTMEVDLGALVHNLNIYRSLLNEGTGIMVMVKALSYGSGSWEIANILQFQKVDYLCVAFIDEGINLRHSGIDLPILVMNPDVSSFAILADHKLEPEIYNFRTLHKMAGVIGKSHLAEYPVHLKLETGMKRLGFDEKELEEMIGFLMVNPQLRIRSVFSHLAASDDPGSDDFTRTQIRIFERMSDKILTSFNYKISRHILNTGGIERFREKQFDMVRLGIGLYGVSTSIKDSLMNVNTLKSVISQVREVFPGESVGYNRQFIAEKEMQIGIVPIGYADGLSRNLGNGRGSFKVDGQLVPIIGNICMDMCMIDLSGTGAEEGDEVIIFGDEFTIEDMAQNAGTIPYELLARISERVKRIYIQ